MRRLPEGRGAGVGPSRLLLARRCQRRGLVSQIHRTACLATPVSVAAAAIASVTRAPTDRPQTGAWPAPGVEATESAATGSAESRDDR